MAQPFLGEIRLIAGSYAPRGWQLCNGQLLAISQNQALFTLLQTYYGGDGIRTFALPNLQGSVAIHQGQGVNLSSYKMGQTAGTTSVTVLDQQMPSHLHGFTNPNVGFVFSAVTGSTTNMPGPTAAFGPAHDLRNIPAQTYIASTDATAPVALPALTPVNTSTQKSPAITDVAGGSQPHNNMQPYLVLNYIIATSGIFPSRN